MRGKTIRLAREALKLFLMSIPEGSKFNVIGFGSEFEVVFDERSVDYNDENLDEIVTWVNEMEADMGGTCIKDPLEDIFENEMAKDVSASHIFLLTDGAIWDTKEVVELVARNCDIF